MNEIDIKSVAREYLGISEIKKDNMDFVRNTDVFLESLNYLTEQQIKSHLDKNPNWSNISHKRTKLHILHYACLTNNLSKVSIVMKYGLDNGVTELPLLKKDYKILSENEGLLSFCTQLNLDKSLAYLTTLLKDPNKQDWKRFISLAIFRGAENVLNLLSKCVPEEEFQKTILETINGTYKDKEGKSRFVRNKFFKDYLDFNYKNFKKFHINPSTALDNGINYLTLLTRALEYNPEHLIKGYDYNSEKEKKQFSTTITKIKDLVSYLALEQNLSWSDKDNLDISPKEYWERFANMTSNTDIKDFGTYIYKEQISRILPKKEDTKRIKI